MAYGSEVAAADFDGDGISDLAVLDSQNVTLRILKGDGKGGFSAASQYRLDGMLISVVAADFNRDGKPDVAVLYGLTDPIGSSTGAVDVLLGNGDGTLAGPASLASGFRLGATFFATADINGDGIPDLIGAQPNELSVSLGKGDGTFYPAGSYTIRTAPVYPFGRQPFAIGDFNGDGKLDIAVTDGSIVTLLLGNGDGTFSMGNTIPFGPASQLGIAAADFNRDGCWDIAVTYGGAGIQIFIGNGDGTFRTGIIMALPFSVYNVAAADVTGDGIPDLIAGGQSGMVVLIGNGDASFQPPWTLAPLAANFAIADFDLDGLLEIAGVQPGGTAVTFLDLSLAVVTAGSSAPGMLAPNSIASAFSRNLGTGSTAAVNVQDSTGVIRAAGIFYASPDQVNFLVPASTALGRATITIASANGNPVRTQATIVAVAPAIFAVGDAGIADAYTIYVAPDGTQTSQLVFTAPAGTIQAAPIDVTSPGQVYLILFGTGFDAAAVNSTTVTVQGVAASVSYAGPQPTWPGLDQVDVLLSPSLAGSGVVSVVLSVAGEQANTVYLAVR